MHGPVCGRDFPWMSLITESRAIIVGSNPAPAICLRTRRCISASYISIIELRVNSGFLARHDPMTPAATNTSASSNALGIKHT